MKRILVALLAAPVFLWGCGGKAPEQAASPAPSFLSTVKQFIGSGTTAPVKTYAAARFLDHASFGPNPEAIADVKARGIESWIDYQLGLPGNTIDATFCEDWDSNATPGTAGRPYYELLRRGFYKLTMTAPEQLRLRVTWALSQFIVVSELKIQCFGATQYFNLLQKHGLDNYADLLRAVSKSPSMGEFLDNNQNKKEGSCPTCSVNENYARELMQLFTLGVSRMNMDGSLVRDASGKLVETYSQDDVQAMARALTGWSAAYPVPAPSLRHSRFRGEMVSTWKESHDAGEKKLLGSVIPAGGTAEQDLEAVIKILMAHPNIAPFVSTRLIQHLVTSDPSPAYIGRVAAVFNDNGKGVKGDMKAVVKAILLDPEARRADDPSVQDNQVGKVREPVLHATALLRGLECSDNLNSPNGGYYGASGQQPFNAASVFSFFAPTHRAPGSLLLAPEQKLLTSNEFSQRLGGLSWIASETPQNFGKAGCRLDKFAEALARSPRDFLNLASERFFRGSMPPTVRSFGETVIGQVTWGSQLEKAAIVLQFLLMTPNFGVIK